MRVLRLGRFFGVDIEVDFSWIFIFLLVTWNLTAVFSGWHPDWGVGVALLVAVVAALAFFVSVLLHELAHSFVAIAQGLHVHSIRLFLLGGVSNIEREPPSPRVEFLTAIVGPAASVGLGVTLLGIASFATRFGVGPSDDLATFLAQRGPVETVLLWLGPVNIAVGLFNLIPAFPLDGGRVLRSIIWSVTHDLRKATFSASLIGQAIGWGFVALGVAMAFGVRVPYFGRGLGAGIWLGIIGWFVSSAAWQSYQNVVITDALRGVQVGRLMRTHGPVLGPNVPLSALMNDWFLRTEERSFPVVENGRLVGLVTIEDLRKVPNAEWDRTTVGSVMTPADTLEVAIPSDSVADALAMLVRFETEQLPVVVGGRLVGMLLRRDIARWLEMQAGHGPLPRQATHAR